MEARSYTQYPSVDALAALSGRRVVMSWESKPKLKGGKSNPQQGRVVKVSTATVTLTDPGAYAKRMVSEGEFDSADEIQGRKWGIRRGASCIIDHKGAVYVEALIDDKPEVDYFLDGRKVDKSEIVGLPESRSDAVKVMALKAENVRMLAEVSE